MLTTMDQNLRKKVKVMMKMMMVLLLKTLKGMKILDQMHKRENYKVLMRLIMRMVLKRKHMMVSCQEIEGDEDGSDVDVNENDNNVTDANNSEGLEKPSKFKTIDEKKNWNEKRKNLNQQKDMTGQFLWKLKGCILRSTLDLLVNLTFC